MKTKIKAFLNKKVKMETLLIAVCVTAIVFSKKTRVLVVRS